MVVTFKKTSRDRSDELKNIALKSTKTFSVQNGTIWLVPFDDCRWKENFLQKLCLVLTGGLLWIGENKDVSSQNNLALVESPSKGSFIKIRIEPWMKLEGTPIVTIENHDCLLSLKIGWVNSLIFRFTSFRTLSNAFEMSGKTPLTSWPLSKDW